MISYGLHGVNLDLNGLKYLIVGAGFYGCTIAERIAEDKKLKVLVVEKRNHIGGNSYSEIEPETGIECHKYGSHIFHTKSSEVWQYLNRFCSFNHYRHKVLSSYKGRMYPIPINLQTINAFYGSCLTPSQAKQMVFAEAEGKLPEQQEGIGTAALSAFGRSLYEAFIEGYSAKQWGIDPSQLPKATLDRLPIRFNYKTDYFDDRWQGIPMDGYGKLFASILNHKNIDVILGVDYYQVSHLVPKDCCVIFSGPIDRFFSYRYGGLKWRSIRFEQEILDVGDYQGTSVVNYPEASVAYTRIHEYRHYHEERCYPVDQTVIAKEYPINSFSGEDPSYPVNTDRDKEICRLYKEQAQSTPNVILGGRLGSYSYLNMDEAVFQALQTYNSFIKQRP